MFVGEMWRALCVCLCVATAVWAEKAPVVTISQGQLEGFVLQSRAGRKFNAYQGIPYAAPPVGPLRFKNPQAPSPWPGVREAVRAGDWCVQATFDYRMFGTEDCLYINVYTHKVSSKVPVLFWIHGGGFFEGAGHEYPPNYLMDKDIVLVTFNYRLGPLGFLSMEDKELSGNFGMKDQVAALRWVRDNIAEFGGDPSAVTIYGESAGAGSVHLLMLSPLAQGLFHRAIAQSGTAYSPWASHPPGRLRATSQRLASLLGCQGTTAELVRCLQAVPAMDFLTNMRKLYEWRRDPTVLFPPAIEPADADDVFMPTDPWRLSSDIPWICGHTSGEGAFIAITYDEAAIKKLSDDFERLAPISLLFAPTPEYPTEVIREIKNFYFPGGVIEPDNFNNLTNMYSDAWFIYPILEAVRRHRGPQYLYYFDYRGANSLSPNHEVVSHFDDVAYFFPLNEHASNRFKTITDEDTKISERLIDLWVNFVIHGTPTIETSNITWPPTKTGREYLHIKKEGFLIKYRVGDAIKERYNFWKNLPFRNKYISEHTVQKDEL